MEVAMKNTVFWDVTQCGSCKEPHRIALQKMLFFNVKLHAHIKPLCIH
jgi:hypothetical protein